MQRTEHGNQDISQGSLPSKDVGRETTTETFVKDNQVRLEVTGPVGYEDNRNDVKPHQAIEFKVHIGVWGFEEVFVFLDDSASPYDLGRAGFELAPTYDANMLIGTIAALPELKDVELGQDSYDLERAAAKVVGPNLAKVLFQLRHGLLEDASGNKHVLSKKGKIELENNSNGTDNLQRWYVAKKVTDSE